MAPNNNRKVTPDRRLVQLRADHRRLRADAASLAIKRDEYAARRQQLEAEVATLKAAIAEIQTRMTILRRVPDVDPVRLEDIMRRSSGEALDELRRTHFHT